MTITIAMNGCFSMAFEKTGDRLSRQLIVCVPSCHMQLPHTVLPALCFVTINVCVSGRPRRIEPLLTGATKDTPFVLICLSAHRSVGALKWMREQVRVG
jgi:hypothetical protein